MKNVSDVAGLCFLSWFLTGCEKSPALAVCGIWLDVKGANNSAGDQMKKKKYNKWLHKLAKRKKVVNHKCFPGPRDKPLFFTDIKVRCRVMSLREGSRSSTSATQVPNSPCSPAPSKSAQLHNELGATVGLNYMGLTVAVQCRSPRACIRLFVI